eukprot:CAMPEP_0202899048 /NCGR_PEP_ID=MMETSP1392-20130828/7395_1 /ASSEMBLY_ACC=CAM_ASM_000868 /TAXON_ID=225041 /ORGANISM="Chlamydomonas chlamydogama, Strain SAG 11-48b" /LENGTH=316 /DNA_ID=CAMNT_0049585135 /DNA_START=231 /DNA_END=1181 /DNA_ORIENTATION=+
MAPLAIYQKENEEGHLSRDFGLLSLTLASGLSGMYFESVLVMCTIFFGGISVYLYFTVPGWLKKRAEQAEKEKAEAVQKAVRALQEQQQQAAAGKELPSGSAVLALIRRRRSIAPKDLNGQRVPRPMIEALLEAANWAPTHNLTEPWRFIVLEGAAKQQFEALTIELVGKYTAEEKRAEALQKMEGKRNKNWPLISCYIAIIMKRVVGKSGKPNPEWEELCSIGAAVQNMYLEATALGLAPFWTSWQAVARDAAEMHTFLGLGEGDRCLGLLTLGMSDRADSYRGSRRPWQDKVTWRSDAGPGGEAAAAAAEQPKS